MRLRSGAGTCYSHVADRMSGLNCPAALQCFGQQITGKRLLRYLTTSRAQHIRLTMIISTKICHTSERSKQHYDDDKEDKISERLRFRIT